MPKTATPTAYQTTVKVPDLVQAYFTVLLSFGQVTFTPGDRHATVRLTAEDDYTLGVQVVRVQQALGQAELVPAFPWRSGLHYGGASSVRNAYRWDIERPTHVAHRLYDARVQVTADVLHFFETLLGLCAVEFTPGTPAYPSQGQEATAAETATLVFADTDSYDMASTVAEIEQELTAWFAEWVTIDRPVAR